MQFSLTPNHFQFPSAQREFFTICKLRRSPSSDFATIPPHLNTSTSTSPVLTVLTLTHQLPIASPWKLTHLHPLYQSKLSSPPHTSCSNNQQIIHFTNVSLIVSPTAALRIPNHSLNTLAPAFALQPFSNFPSSH